MSWDAPETEMRKGSYDYVDMVQAAYLGLRNCSWRRGASKVATARSRGAPWQARRHKGVQWTEQSARKGGGHVGAAQTGGRGAR